MICIENLIKYVRSHKNCNTYFEMVIPILIFKAKEKEYDHKRKIRHV